MLFIVRMYERCCFCIAEKNCLYITVLIVLVAPSIYRSNFRKMRSSQEVINPLVYFILHHIDVYIEPIQKNPFYTCWLIYCAFNILCMYVCNENVAFRMSNCAIWEDIFKVSWNSLCGMFLLNTWHVLSITTRCQIT